MDGALLGLAWRPWVFEDAVSVIVREFWRIGSHRTAGVAAFAFVFAMAFPIVAQRQMEKLGRGLVAVNQGEGMKLRTQPSGR